MKILMTATRLGSPDGIKVHSYEADTEYDVPDDLAHAFLSTGAAIEPKPAKMNKADNAETENKALGDAPENKATKSKK